MSDVLPGPDSQSGMGTAAEPLANLRDIHQPDAIGLWPLAPGWWIVLVVSLLSILAVIWGIKRYRKNQFRREACRLLRAQFQQWQSDGDSRLYLRQVNKLMKQSLMTQGAGPKIAAVSGDSWFAVIKQTAPGVRCETFFTQASLQYQQQSIDAAKIPEIQAEILSWLKQHEVRHLLTMPVVKTKEASHA